MGDELPQQGTTGQLQGFLEADVLLARREEVRLDVPVELDLKQCLELRGKILEVRYQRHHPLTVAQSREVTEVMRSA